MDLSDRFAETLPCGCEWHAGTMFHCAVHFQALSDLTVHSQHKTPVQGCNSCDDLLDEARALQSERPWDDDAA